MVSILKLLIKWALLVLICQLPIKGQKSDADLGIVSDAKWVKYFIGKDGVSVELPKMPVVLNQSNACESYERSIYASYTEDVVYTAVITEGTNGQYSGFCSRSSRFGTKTLENRIEQLILSNKVERTDVVGLKENIIRLTGDTHKINVINDIENKRFIELWITTQPGKKVDPLEFFNSLSLNKVNSAVKLKGGAVKTIGDVTVKPFDSALWSNLTEGQINQPYIIVHRPRASYTEAARIGGTTGTVILKVTLLANGSIGKITSERSLRNGLTEQAIKAAQRLVFIPRKVKGKSEDTVETIEYSFLMY